MIHENKKIQNADDFNDYACDIISDFLQSFTKENGLIRDIDEDDYADPEEYAFVYTDRGTKLFERMRFRLIKVGEKHFPNEDIEVNSHLFIEL